VTRVVVEYEPASPPQRTTPLVLVAPRA